MSAPARRIKIVGLTGGIASGKSTAAALLAARGVPVFDADQLARDVVEPGTPALREIAARWPGVISPDGHLDRAALAAIAFADASERGHLTRIVVPRIVAAFRERVRDLEDRGERICVFQAPTLLEENLDAEVDGVLLVSLPEDEQIARFRARSGQGEREARERLAAQLPLEQKRARATWLLDNSGTPEELESALTLLWRRVLNDLGLS